MSTIIIMGDFMEKIIYNLNDILWGFFMIALLILTHIYMTFKTGFIQKKTFYAIRLSISGDARVKKEGASPFGALMTSLAATLGTGNIIGVGTAVYLGGAGAVFWCWLTGVLGFATKYAETYIALKYRVFKKDGKATGGAMYVLKNRLGYKLLSFLFALFCVLASLGVGCSVQVSSIKDAVSHLNMSDLSVGIILAVLVFLSVSGGIKSVFGLLEKLIPFMCGLFLLGSFLVLFINYAYIKEALISIFREAFSVRSLGAGILGRGIMCAMRYGTSRGLFSNEAGMGASAIASCQGGGDDNVSEALIASVATFFDTVVMCFITGLCIVSSVLKNPSLLSLGETKLCEGAFSVLPFGESFIRASIVLFAFSTVVGWAFYGEGASEFLLGKKGIFLYRALLFITVIFSCFVKSETVWAASDIFNALMAFPNLIMLFILSDEIEKDTKNYFAKKGIKKST